MNPPIAVQFPNPNDLDPDRIHDALKERLNEMLQRCDALADELWLAHSRLELLEAEDRPDFT